LKITLSNLGLHVASASGSPSDPRAAPPASTGSDPEGDLAALDGRRRVIIDDLRPQVGHYPIKRAIGEEVRVEADLLADGHDQLAGVLRHRRPGGTWQETSLAFADNDTWCATFVVDAIGTWEFTVSGWVDGWATWAVGLRRKQEARQDIEVELQGGAAMAAEAAARARGEERAALLALVARLRDRGEATGRAEAALSPEIAALMRANADRAAATTFEPPITVTVDPHRAGFSSWYEMFPRSTGAEGRHGTLRDAEQRLRYVAEMGFDVVYLPPIHPIGRTFRKGPDNSLQTSPSDPGSPWAIGSAEGGHKAIHPDLGTAEDFRRLVRAAREQGLEVALDIALQASPDHPYVAQHPEWFVHRADGSIQYAENPPKKYQDIYPFDFTGAAWRTLWRELRDIFFHWIEQGVTIFRVDNPHTKPIPFWEWCIRTVKARHPEAIFLAEAFTRPKLMYLLAKVGFSQSYTYFTWRATKAELTEYVRSLVETDVGEFFRPNFWPNTPDILPEHLQFGTRATFIARATLAATLSPNWGIYGPAYELQERVAREGAEEYAQNEKYQLRSWDLGRPDSLRPVLRRLNEIRKNNPALQRLAGTTFHETDNEFLLCYSRVTADHGNAVLVVVNLDPHNQHAGWLTLELLALGLDKGSPFQAHDLMSDARFFWQGERAFVSLDPKVMPVHVFRLRRRVRSEQSFEYYL
jgi:starch synthase (maltosyl-transferring)